MSRTRCSTLTPTNSIYTEKRSPWSFSGRSTANWGNQSWDRISNEYKATTTPVYRSNQRQQRMVYHLLDKAGCTRRRPWPPVAQPYHLALPAMHSTEVKRASKKTNNQMSQSTLIKLASTRFEKASWRGTPRRSNGSIRFGKKCRVFRNENKSHFVSRIYDRSRFMRQLSIGRV
jgi:hypothetical protein